MKERILILLLVLSVIIASITILVVFKKEEKIKEQENFTKTINLLLSSHNKLESINNIKIYQYVKKIEKNSTVVYDICVNKINGKYIIKFMNFSYVISGNDKKMEIMYKRLKYALENAIIVDYGEDYYLYMPKILENKIAKYSTRNSIFRYYGIPIIDCLHLASLTFINAGNAIISGNDNIVVNNNQTLAQVVNYTYYDHFTGKIDIATWISEDLLPIKAKLYMPSSDILLEIKMENYYLGCAEDFNISAYKIVKR